MAELHDGRRAVLLARVGVFAPGFHQRRVLELSCVFGGEGWVEGASEVIYVDLDVSCRGCQSSVSLRIIHRARLGDLTRKDRAPCSLAPLTIHLDHIGRRDMVGISQHFSHGGLYLPLAFYLQKHRVFRLTLDRRLGNTNPQGNSTGSFNGEGIVSVIISDLRGTQELQVEIKLI